MVHFLLKFVCIKAKGEGITQSTLKYATAKRLFNEQVETLTDNGEKLLYFFDMD